LGEELNQNGNLKLSAGNYSFDKDGSLLVKNGEKLQKIGEVRTYDSVGGDGLLSSGESLFTPREGVAMAEVQDRNILQGYLENSNVDVGQEMTDMILTQRAFQLSSTGLKTVDEMWHMINSLR